MTWSRATAARRLVAAAVTAAVAVLLAPVPAPAHSDLVGSAPADGSVLQAPPESVTLTFNEDVEPQFATVAITVGDGDATEVAARVQAADVIAATASANTATSERGEPTPWVVAYRVVSADGHPITGTVSFTVTTPAPPPAPSATPNPPSPEPAPSPSPSPAATADETVRQSAAGQAAGPSITGWILAAAGAVLIAAISAWLYRRRGGSES